MTFNLVLELERTVYVKDKDGQPQRQSQQENTELELLLQADNPVDKSQSLDENGVGEVSTKVFADDKCKKIRLVWHNDKSDGCDSEKTKLAGWRAENKNLAVSFAINSIAEPNKKRDSSKKKNEDDKTISLKIANNTKNERPNEIEFYIDTKNDQDKRLFGQLSGFSYVSIKIKDELPLFSDFFLCSYPEGENENIEGIISEVAEKYSEIAVENPKGSNQPEKMNFNNGTFKPKTRKELVFLLKFICKITETYREYLKYLKIKAAHKIEKESVPVPFYCVKNINIRDTLKKDLRFFTENKSRVGSKYLPVFVHGEVKRKSFETYENTTILQFLVTVADSVGSLKKFLEGQIAAGNSTDQKRYITPSEILVAVPDSQYCPVCVNSIPLDEETKKLLGTLDKYSRELQMLIKEYSSMFHIYGKGNLDRMPRSTKVFQEVHPYNRFFEIMVHWFRDGTAAEKLSDQIKRLTQTKSMDKLFEYYCLLKLKEMLLAHRYVCKEPEPYTYIDKVEGAKDTPYKPYKEEIEIYNTFKFERENDKEPKKVVLYYRPYIPNENGRKELDLYRVMPAHGDSEYNYYEPDFVLKFSKNDQKEDVYVILDSKFSRMNIIKLFHLYNILPRYAEGLNVNGQKYKKPVMVWALQGRSDSNACTPYILREVDEQNKDERSFGIQPFTPECFKAANGKKPTDTLWNEIDSCLERCWQESSANGQNGT